MIPQSGLLFAALGFVSALVTFFAIKPLMPLMQRYALARPNARSSHVTPTPQGGGIPIVLMIALGLVFALVFGLVPQGEEVVAFTLGIAVLALAGLGLVDDIKTLPVLPRLAVQFGASIALMIVTPHDVTVFDGYVSLMIERAIVAVALVWMINLTNFMDGLDWITVAQFVPLSLALAIASVLGLVSPLIGLVAALLVGGLIGFAPYNRPVAKLFLGDVGSLPIGLVAGYALYRYGASTWIVPALLLALYPVADATVTLVMRIRRGEKVWVAHRTHFYQQATQHGYRVIDVVRHVALAGSGFAILSLTIAWLNDPTNAAVLCVIAAIAIVGTLRRFSGRI